MSDPGGLVGVGLLSALVAAAAVYFTQHNRHGDKDDARILRETANRSEDTRAALAAWQGIVNVNVVQLADQQAQIVTLRARADECDELTRNLRAKVAELSAS